MINGFLYSSGYPAENFHFIRWVENINLSFFPEATVDWGCREWAHLTWPPPSLSSWKWFNKFTLGKYPAVHLLPIRSFDGPPVGLGLVEQIWTERMVRGMESSWVTATAHICSSGWDLWSKITVQQKVMWVPRALSNSQGTKASNQSWVVRQREDEVWFFLLLSLARHILSGIYHKSSAHSQNTHSIPYSPQRPNTSLGSNSHCGSGGRQRLLARKDSSKWKRFFSKMLSDVCRDSISPGSLPLFPIPVYPSALTICSSETPRLCESWPG